DPVGDAQAFRDFGGGIDHCEATSGSFTQQPEHLCLGAHVDASGWFVQQHQPGVGADNLANDDLLLVPSGQGTDAQFRSGGLDGDGFDEFRGAGLVHLAIDQAPGNAGHDAGQGQVAADVKGLHQAIALTVLGHQSQPGVDTLSDRLFDDRAPLEGDLPGQDRLPAGDSFQEFGASGAHQAVDAHDLPAAYFQVDAVHDGPLGVLPAGDRQIAPLQDGFAELVARRRFAQVEVLPDHVPHDPFQVDVAALTVCSDAAVAQHDGPVGHLEGFLQVVGDVDDGHSAGEELADDLEE